MTILIPDQLRKALETAFRRFGGIPAIARSEGGASKIIDICVAEAQALPALSPDREPVGKTVWHCEKCGAPYLMPGKPVGKDEVEFIDALAQEIRRVDGSNSLGAAALAEALSGFLRVSYINEHARNKAMQEALERIASDLNCQGTENAHYCPNCDNSLFDTRAVARAALSTGER